MATAAAFIRAMGRKPESGESYTDMLDRRITQVRDMDLDALNAYRRRLKHVRREADDQDLSAFLLALVEYCIAKKVRERIAS